MADGTHIEWAGASLNPVRARDRETGKIGWHCEHATPGCEGCYAEAINRRLGTGHDFIRQNRDKVELFLDTAILARPLHWRRGRVIFWHSMTDNAAEFMQDDWLDQAFAVCAVPACQLKGAKEHGLAIALRAAEASLARYHDEDSDKDRALGRMQAEHTTALRREEEKGYARGLRDERERCRRIITRVKSGLRNGGARNACDAIAGDLADGSDG